MALHSRNRATSREDAVTLIEDEGTWLEDRATSLEDLAIETIETVKPAI